MSRKWSPELIPCGKMHMPLKQIYPEYFRYFRNMLGTLFRGGNSKNASPPSCLSACWGAVSAGTLRTGNHKRGGGVGRSPLDIWYISLSIYIYMAMSILFCVQILSVGSPTERFCKRASESERSWRGLVPPTWSRMTLRIVST